MTIHSLPRRRFLSVTALGRASSALTNDLREQSKPAVIRGDSPRTGEFPVVALSSANGLAATKTADEMIAAGKDPLEAVVAGVAIVEADPQDTSVGYGCGAKGRNSVRGRIAEKPDCLLAFRAIC